jgi:hypothetical protein
MDELRATVARLRSELVESNVSVRPPPAIAADRQRR